MLAEADLGALYNERIAGHAVLQVLGDGRTAIVYLAVDPLGREVALKVPKPEVLDDPKLGYMFRNEVGLAHSLKHPHIVPSYGGDAGGDEPYLALHYYADGTIANRRLPQAVILQVLSDVASVLHYLHSQGFVHQDVKAANIFEEDGRGYLGDFGTTTNQAQASRTAGSPFYMAPELFSGGRNTPQSDIYALGVVAFELLTGRRPIEGQSFEEVQAAHVIHSPSSVRSGCRGLPLEASTVIDAALRKDPSVRPSAMDFRCGIEAALANPVDGGGAGRPATDQPRGGRIEARAMRAKEQTPLWSRLLKRKE